MAIKPPKSKESCSVIQPTYTSIFPRIGVFRKGTRKQVITQKKGKPCTPYEIVGKDLGEKFRFAASIDDSYKQMLLIEAIQDLCGSTEPTTIRAELMGATAAEVFYGAYTQHRTDRSLLIECDGQTISKQYNDHTKRTASVNKPCLNKDDRLMHCQDCQPTGKLHIFFPELFLKSVELADGTGYVFYGGFDILTSSISDGFQIPEMLEGFEMIANSQGETLQGLPVIITRKATKYSGTDRKPKKKENGVWIDSPTFMQSYKKEDWFINIEIDMYRWMQKLAAKGKRPFEIAASSQAVFAGNNQAAIAPASDVKDDEINIKDLFKQMLADNDVDLQFNGNGSFISKKLYQLGYKQSPDNGKGDASQIPIDKLDDVVAKVVEALETHNNLNLQPAIATKAEVISEVTVKPEKPIKSAFDPDEASQYLDAIATTEPD